MEKLRSGRRQGDRELGDGSEPMWFATLGLVGANLCGEANFVNEGGLSDKQCTFAELQYLTKACVLATDTAWILCLLV